MPKTKNTAAEKRHRQSENLRLRNRMTESRVKTMRKKFLVAVEKKDRNEAASQLKVVEKLIDSAASKGVYKKNTAARKKSRLHRLLNSMSKG